MPDPAGGPPSGSPPLDGGCACGAVRYRMHRAPMFVHCCHCTRCQRKTGGPFGREAAAQAAFPMSLDRAVPVLASLDIERTVAFFCTRLGFTRVMAQPGTWGIVARDAVQIHFWPCAERRLAENTSCRIDVTGIDALYREFEPQGVIHPNAPLQAKPWGRREFGILDPDGNLVVFAEPVTSDE